MFAHQRATPWSPEIAAILSQFAERVAAHQNGRYVDKNPAVQKVWGVFLGRARRLSDRKLVRPSGFEPPTFCTGGTQTASKASFSPILFLGFSTIWGVCLRSADNPNGLRFRGFDTVLIRSLRDKLSASVWHPVRSGGRQDYPIFGVPANCHNRKAPAAILPLRCSCKL